MYPVTTHITKEKEREKRETETDTDTECRPTAPFNERTTDPQSPTTYTFIVIFQPETGLGREIVCACVRARALACVCDGFQQGIMLKV